MSEPSLIKSENIDSFPSLQSGESHNQVPTITLTNHPASPIPSVIQSHPPISSSQAMTSSNSLSIPPNNLTQTLSQSNQTLNHELKPITNNSTGTISKNELTRNSTTSSDLTPHPSVQTNKLSGSDDHQEPAYHPPSSLNGGTIALLVLLSFFITLLASFIFWRRRRKAQSERRDAAADMEQVHITKLRKTSEVESSMGLDPEKNLEPTLSESETVIAVDHESQDPKAHLGPRRGIVRNSRPTSLLLKQQQAQDKKMFAIGETPSPVSHPSTPQPTTTIPPLSHLRPYRAGRDRPASWRSSIAVAWANLGIPTKILGEPGGGSTPDLSSLSRTNSDRSTRSRLNPFKAFHFTRSRPQLPPTSSLHPSQSRPPHHPDIVEEDESSSRSQSPSSSSSFDIESSTHQSLGSGSQFTHTLSVSQSGSLTSSQIGSRRSSSSRSHASTELAPQSHHQTSPTIQDQPIEVIVFAQ